MKHQIARVGIMIKPPCAIANGFESIPRPTKRLHTAAPKHFQKNRYHRFSSTREKSN